MNNRSLILSLLAVVFTTGAFYASSVLADTHAAPIDLAEGASSSALASHFDNKLNDNLGPFYQGSGNTGYGSYALRNTTGSYNSAFGYYALYSNTTGGDNTASGFEALDSNTTGSDNTALGRGGQAQTSSPAHTIS